MDLLPNSLWPTAPEPTPWWDLGVVEPMFLLSYVVGLIVLMVFSWNRLFNEHVFNADEEPEKILRLMPPGDLRGTVAVIQAYLIYVIMMATVFSVLSWGGSFIWSVIVQLNFGLVAGQPTASEAPYKFDDPSWPLAVSLGLVGVLTHLPYLKEVELTFRAWAHRSIGIPPFVKQLTQLVLNTRFDRAQMSARAETDLEQAEIMIASASSVLGENEAEEFAKRIRRITLLDRWLLSEQAQWPRVDVTNRFEPMVRELRRDVSDLIDDINGAVILLSDIAQQETMDRDPAKHDQAVRKWRTLFGKTETVHRDVCALIAVYLENDPAVPDTLDPMFADFLLKIEDRREEEAVNWDRILTILLSIGMLVLGLTWIATVMSYNPPFADFSPISTAALQTLIVIVTYGPSSLMALSIQQRAEAGGRWRDWERTNGTYPVRQFLGVFVWSYLISALMLFGLYFILFLGLANELSKGMDNFIKFIPFYLAYALLGGLQGIFTPLAHSSSSADTNTLLGVWQRFRVPMCHAALAALVLIVTYNALGPLIAGPGQNAVLVYWFLILQASLVAFAATYLSAWTAPPPRELPVEGVV